MNKVTITPAQMTKIAYEIINCGNSANVVAQANKIYAEMKMIVTLTLGDLEIKTTVYKDVEPGTGEYLNLQYMVSNINHLEYANSDIKAKKFGCEQYRRPYKMQ